MKNDSLGDRIKGNYESRYRVMLPRRTNVIIRLDGKAFHTFTSKFKKPYDYDLMNAMDSTAIYLCENIMGAKMAYVQSDEISVLLCDYDQITTEGWFDYNLQKMCSVSAGLATAKFNQVIREQCEQYSINILPIFDSRVFVVADPVEVHNTFHWRQEDAIRNSIQMYGQAHFSSKQLHGVSCEKIKEKLLDKGIDWEEAPSGFKYGRVIHKVYYEEEVYSKDPKSNGVPVEVTRSKWEVDLSYPVFKGKINYVLSKMPQSE